MAKTLFYTKHKNYLDKDRFHNGAAFKPYILLDLLDRLNDGDIVLYYDCGPYTIRMSLSPLVDLCIRNRGTVFHQWGDRNLNWTKRDAFVSMGCDTPQYHNAVALQNTWFLMEKNDFSVRFAKEWLQYNLDERIASYVMRDTCGRPPLRGFIENRGDQSIFTNLAIKYNLRTFFGLGGPYNKDINNFIASIPNTPSRALAWGARRMWVRLKRKLEFRRRYRAKLKSA